MELSYEICYRKGKENVVLDALSRREKREESECTAITIVIPEGIREVIKSHQGDD